MFSQDKEDKEVKEVKEDLSTFIKETLITFDQVGRGDRVLKNNC